PFGARRRRGPSVRATVGCPRRCVLEPPQEGVGLWRRSRGERGPALQARAPVRSPRHRLQRVLAGGAALHVLLARFAGAVVARGVQEALELVAARAVRHSNPSNLRTSSRIISLTWLLAPYTRAIFISSRPAAAEPVHPSSAVS